MENDKPSNPQQQGADSTDLIEEMSRLLSQDKNTQQPAPAPAAPRSPVSTGDQQSPAQSDSSGKGWLPSAAPAPNLAPTAPPEPVAEPIPAPNFGLRQEPPTPAPRVTTPPLVSKPAEPKPESAGSTPSWMPKTSEPELPTAPRIDLGSLDLGLDKPTPQPTPQQAPPLAIPAAAQPEVPPIARHVPLDPPKVLAPIAAPITPEPSQVFQPVATPIRAGLKPEPVTVPRQAASPSVSAPISAPIPQPQAPKAPTAPDFSFDLGMGQGSPSDSAENLQTQAPTPASQPAAPVEDDPIAELIRAQLAGTKAQPVAGEYASDDKFSIAPVLGLGGTLAPKKPLASSGTSQGSEALDDIESLIGNAVRLESEDANARSAVEGPRPMPKPAAANRSAQGQNFGQPVPAPPAQTGPRPAAIEIEDNVSAAEAAIMAAMQPAQNLGDQQQSGFSSTDQNSQTQQSRSAAFGSINWARAAVPVAAILLLGVIGFAGYNLFSGSFGTGGETPIVLAASGDTKQDPEPTTDPAADSSVVLDGNATSPDAEQIVSRDQSQETNDPIRQIITADTTENGLANRKVRTVTVRPDGTIIQGDDQVAAGETLATDRPNVPELPASAVVSDLADTTVASLTADNATPSATASLVAVDGNAVPFPLPRMTDRAARLASATTVVQQPAAAQTTNLVTATPVTSSAAWVQLASQRSQGAANDTVAQLTRQYGSFFNGQSLQVQRADLGDRGVFYRIMLPASSLTDATNICTRIQTAGGNCFPRNN